MGSAPVPSDEDLLRLVARGDTLAFQHLVSKYQARLRASAHRLLRNRVDAEDVVQEVFTRAWIHAGTWRPRGSSHASYAAWLSRVTINVAIDHKRRTRTVPLDETDEFEDPGCGPEATVLSRERTRLVRAAIAALPERQLMALSLTYDAELSNAEGANAMNISTGAFELLLVRARRALRTSLSEV